MLLEEINFSDPPSLSQFLLDVGVFQRKLHEKIKVFLRENHYSPISNPQLNELSKDYTADIISLVFELLLDKDIKSCDFSTEKNSPEHLANLLQELLSKIFKKSDNWSFSETFLQINDFCPQENSLKQTGFGTLWKAISNSQKNVILFHNIVKDLSLSEEIAQLWLSLLNHWQSLVFQSIEDAFDCDLPNENPYFQSLFWLNLADRLKILINSVNECLFGFANSSETISAQKGVVYTSPKEIEFILFLLFSKMAKSLANPPSDISFISQCVYSLSLSSWITPFFKLQDTQMHKLPLDQPNSGLLHSWNELWWFFRAYFSEKIVVQSGFFSILDPACGSGQFLLAFQKMVLFSEIVHSLFENWGYHPQISWVIKLDKTPSLSLPFAFIGTEIHIGALYGSNLLFQMQQNTCPSSLSPKATTCTNLPYFPLMGDFLFLAQDLTPISIIFGNPPYVRLRDLNAPYYTLLDAKDYRKQIYDLLKHKIKTIENEKQYVGENKNQTLPISKRFDYSLYFFYFGWSILGNGGMMCFISSNSWTNVKYGYDFQQFLLEAARDVMICNNNSRSFLQADINTIITFLEKSPILPPDSSPIISRISQQNKVGKVMFLSLFFPFDVICCDLSQLNSIHHTLSSTNSESAVPHYNPSALPNRTNKTLNGISEGLVFSETKYFHWLQIGRKSLWNFMGASTPNHYEGFNWGNYFFSGSQTFFKLLQHLNTKIIRLSDIATIRRGLTTNCNDYFLLKKGMNKNIAQTNTINVINGYGDQFNLPFSCLVPIIISPRQIKSPISDKKDFQTYFFDAKFPKSVLCAESKTSVCEYIDYGEKKELNIKKGTLKGSKIVGVQNLASFQSRYLSDPDRWFLFPEMSQDPFIFIEKIFSDTLKLGICDGSFRVNNTFYEIRVKPDFRSSLDIRFLMGLLLSCLTPFSLELEGRTNFGGGALDTATFDIENILLFDPQQFTTFQKNELAKIFENVFQVPFSRGFEYYSHPTLMKMEENLWSFVGLSELLDSTRKELFNLQHKRINKAKINKAR